VMKRTAYPWPGGGASYPCSVVPIDRFVSGVSNPGKI
jgi:hypothetical protein